MKEGKVAEVFIVMPRDSWPSSLEQVQVYASGELARAAINEKGRRLSYLQRKVIEIDFCPTCGAEKGGKP